MSLRPWKALNPEKTLGALELGFQAPRALQKAEVAGACFSRFSTAAGWQRSTAGHRRKVSTAKFRSLETFGAPSNLGRPLDATPEPFLLHKIQRPATCVSASHPCTLSRPAG